MAPFGNITTCILICNKPLKIVLNCKLTKGRTFCPTKRDLWEAALDGALHASRRTREHAQRFPSPPVELSTSLPPPFVVHMHTMVHPTTPPHKRHTRWAAPRKSTSFIVIQHFWHACTCIDLRSEPRSVAELVAPPRGSTRRSMHHSDMDAPKRCS